MIQIRSRTMLLALVVGLVGCSQEQARQRVLIVGLDGASLRVVRPLLDQGELPNLAAIARDGVYGKLRSLMPISSPRIWNTVATGKIPSKHGIEGFAHLDAQGVQRLYLSTDRVAHALWNIASSAGLSVGVVNFWNTYPTERVNGVMISDHVLAKQIEGRTKMSKAAGTPEGGSITYPEAWNERVAALYDATERVSAAINPFEPGSGLPRWSNLKDLTRRFEEDDKLVRMALEIEHDLSPDLMMVLLPGIDRVSHFLWGVLEPPSLYPEGLRPNDDEREAGKQALLQTYRQADELVGHLMASYDDDDLVIVLSDHGFEAGTGMMVLTGTHESRAAIDGILFARGRGVPRGKPLGRLSVRDITPTVLVWLGLPLGDDMDGKPAPFLAVRKPQRIPTHDTEPIERLSLVPSGVENEIVDQLRGLGYVE